VAFLAGGQLDDAVGVEVVERDRPGFGWRGVVVDTCPTAFDEAPRLARRNSSKAAMPDRSSARPTSIEGNPAAASPSSKVRRAVSAASSAASAPCTSFVTSKASTFLASLTSESLSFASLSISAGGSSVNSFRKRTTSASCALRQNW
jgi:hypothetical protein